MTAGPSGPAWQQGFRLSLRHGVCIGVPIDDSAFAELLAAERAIIEGRAAHRQRSWASGRRALRGALRELGVEAGPLMVDELGAPVVPEGVVGSISHTNELAVALAARANEGAVGIDVERLRTLRGEVGRRILTPREMAPLAPLAGEARDAAIITRFSIKEAIYKAIAPRERRYVDFHEVELEFAEGAIEVRTSLPYALEVECVARDNWVLATARAVG